MYLPQLISDLEAQKSPAKAKDFAWFFKTGPGEYGEEDQFYGITTEPLMFVVRKYWRELDFKDIDELLSSPFHECRTVAVSTLRHQFGNAGIEQQAEIFNYYLKHTSRINNWDLVDVSAPYIVGQYLLNKDRSILYTLAKSDLLWDRRISIISTATFIRNNQYKDTLEISRTLMDDKEDLIHKAVGWMLREVGKKDQKVLTKFLDQFCLKLPRTALRYAIEKFPPDLRQHYLKLK